MFIRTQVSCHCCSVTVILTVMMAGLNTTPRWRRNGGGFLVVPRAALDGVEMMSIVYGDETLALVKQFYIARGDSHGVDFSQLKSSFHERLQRRTTAIKLSETEILICIDFSVTYLVHLIAHATKCKEPVSTPNAVSIRSNIRTTSNRQCEPF